MRAPPPSIQRLIQEFNKLPGIGSKTSERFVYYLLRQSKGDVDALAESIRQLKSTIRLCAECYTYTEQERCSICADASRSRELVCVVAEPQDVAIIETAGSYTGVYHVLGGVISPVDGMGPAELRIQELVDRVSASGNGRPHIEEVIIATNPDSEGETTALFIAQQLKNTPVLITKIARGLPMGADIAFADEITLANALACRQKL